VPLLKVRAGFYKGRDYRALSDLERRRYAAGVVDGMLLAPTFGAPNPISEAAGSTTRYRWLTQCVTDMTDDQVAAIISKYLDAHPEHWHQDAHLSAYRALLDACPGSAVDRD
jgi:hypothetical protein